MKRILVLVEGQTEETFVRDVLEPHLQALDIHPTAVVLKTKRVKAGGAFRGGVTSTAQVLGDIARLLADSSALAITTIIDYYGLPGDFPGMQTRQAAADPYARVAHVEAALSSRVGDRRFLPHLTLHEYEAWIFSEPGRCAWVFAGPDIPGRLQGIRDQCGGAERINEQRDTCASRRLLEVYPEYQKQLHGPLAVGAIGLPVLRAACPHANAWLARLESL